ncbi:MAG: L-2-hydroxyglutarate oxidase [Desulfuromonadales bacterium]|nr:L-2-hydroxyglutarate oxidase [Desulfuromonadales bacterium]
MCTSADLAIIGGGIVGCATALAIISRNPDLKILLFEKETQLASHQTGHNSGVIHAGLYYLPGSLKATTCTSGREALYRFCAEHDIPHQRCGKVVMAVNEAELPALDELERRGQTNGLKGLQRLNASELKEREPHVRGVAGLHVPQTGIVDYVRVTLAMAEIFKARGGVIHLHTPIMKISQKHDDYLLQAGSRTFRARALVNCAGLHADRVARSAGLFPDLRIVPFRGEYYAIKPKRSHLVKHLIYPVPNPQMPFLGVHFTRMIDGTVEAGPNAVLAWQREGYHRSDISLRDIADTLSFAGFWKLSARFWRVGLEEHGRSFSKRLFVKSLQRLIPEIEPKDLVPGGSGVRAQAVDREGKMVDDFCILTEGRMIHVLNAPSPAATASLSIAEHIADRVTKVIS